MPVDRVVAHILYRWPPEENENNLAWSIISKLKRVRYLSAYKPEDDSGVRDELDKLKTSAETS
jgi:hypothetical protein